MAEDPKSSSELILYQTEDGSTRVEVRLENETVWLTQNLMAELFQSSVPNVSIHIRNLFKEGELQPDSVVKEFLTTAADGKNYQTRFYNLDVISSYDVNTLLARMKEHPQELETQGWRIASPVPREPTSAAALREEPPKPNNEI